MEKWISLDRLPGYEVSNIGNVRSLKRGKVTSIKPSLSSSGYRLVCLLDKNKRRTTNYIHRLVAEAFIPTENLSRAIVNHKDRDRLNNAVDNLEWVTYTENIFHHKDVDRFDQLIELEKLCSNMSIDQLRKVVEFCRKKNL
jgi:hypothetical protein